MPTILLTLSVLFLLAGCNGDRIRTVEPLDPKTLAPAMSVDRIFRGVGEARDLVFPAGVSDISEATRPVMAIYKPAGQGPFPGLVLAHQCGGLNNSRTGWQNESMLTWAKKAVARGYVVFLIDQLTQRGLSTRCRGKSGGLNFARATKDVFQAADHLRSFPFVDPERVALAGFSFGAMLALLASSERWGSTLATDRRFAAAVSFYPGCLTIQPRRGMPYEIVNTDIDRPLLVLLGEKDSDTPAAECIQRLELARNQGSSVEWHVYPDTTHCWDCRNLHGHSKTTYRGYYTTYYYNEPVTNDSTARMFDFLDRYLGADLVYRP